jgi:hypothetical protein
MLKIRAGAKQRAEVRALCAEYMSDLRGDYDTLMVRLDALAVEIGTVRKESLPIDKLNELDKTYQDSIELMQQEVRAAIENIDTSQVDEIQHRLEFVEERLGI